MKIAIVCLNLGWQTGGPRLIFSFAQALQRAGHRVKIYAPDYNPHTYPELSAGLDIEKVNLGEEVSWSYSGNSLWSRIMEKTHRERALNAIVRKIAEVIDADCDVLNVHDYAYKVSVRYAKRNPRAKIVWTMNDVPYMYMPKANPIYDILTRAYNWWAAYVARHGYFPRLARGVVFREENAKWMRSQGINPLTLWPGIDYEAFYAPPKPATKRKSFVVLGVGAFNRFRRYDEVIAAARILRDKGLDARVLLICKDIWDAREDKKEILAKTKEWGMEPYVTFRFDGASETELKKFYRESDVFVASTHIPPPRNGYSWGLALFEAAAAGIPIVLSKCNDAQEAIPGEKGSLLFTPGEPKEIAAQVARLMEDPVLCNAIRTYAQQVVKEKMNWDYYTSEFVKGVAGER
jgi:glycosyltransferase involved in cell wall biosynthesis